MRKDNDVEKRIAAAFLAAAERAFGRGGRARHGHDRLTDIEQRLAVIEEALGIGEEGDDGG
jgi:hypothetical protein